MKNKKRITILGAGTAGTIMANKLAKKFEVTIIDAHPDHYYQPGFLFLPFKMAKIKQIVKPKKNFITKKAKFLQIKVAKINPERSSVSLADGTDIEYDLLIIATGSRIVPDEIEGLKGPLWQKDIFDFYSLDGALKLQDKLANWQGGKLVVNIAEMPIKCPVAPLEFSFLADSYFKKRKMRDKVDITYVTPLTGAFTKPKASEKLGHLLDERNIRVEPEFSIMEIDNQEKKIVSYEGREVPFDLLVSIPTNKGSQLVIDSGLGDELGFIDTDHNTLQARAFSNIFVAGDATNVPASKAGSTAHFETEVLYENIQRFFKGQELAKDFDGHANCFVETGGGKALLIDFNYDVEPLEGKFPFAVIGPMSLLKESRLNHIGKLAFRHIYWHMLLKARPIPFIPNKLKLSGKKIDKFSTNPKSTTPQAEAINAKDQTFDERLAKATDEEKKIADESNNNITVKQDKE